MKSCLDRPARTAFVVAVVAFMSGIVGAYAASRSGALPDRVTFTSADGATALVGYVFKPEGAHAARTPAVVMMHGRAGAYSSAAKDKYDASTLSRRHQAWGHIWAKQGYLAILVDGFSPRGYPHGFHVSVTIHGPIRSMKSPCARSMPMARWPICERGRMWSRTGLRFKAGSNGGSATLATMSRTAPGISAPTPATGFRAGLVFYPACGLKGLFNDGILPYAPVRVFQGSATKKSRRAVAPIWSRRAARLAATSSFACIRMRPTISTIRRHRTRT